jgi:hydrogenase expression/formation protein HypC
VGERTRCVTCGDAATAARVVALGDDGLARVVSDDGESEVSVELVDARIGDVLLVHAGIAIGIAP